MLEINNICHCLASPRMSPPRLIVGYPLEPLLEKLQPGVVCAMLHDHRPFAPPPFLFCSELNIRNSPLLSLLPSFNSFFLDYII